MTVKRMSVILIVGFLLAFGHGDLLAAEGERFRYVSSSISPPSYCPPYRTPRTPMSPQTHSLGVTDAESKERKGDKPPLSAMRIINEILSGGIAGTFLGAGGGYLGMVLELVIYHKCVHLCLAGALVGCISGNTLGVYTVGNSGNETGSILATLGGSILGIGAGIAAGVIVAHISETVASVSFLSIPSIGAIGATIGFNLTRRYKSPPASEAALINLSDGQMILALPTIYFRPDPSDGRRLSQSVDLVRVKF